MRSGAVPVFIYTGAFFVSIEQESFVANIISCRSFFMPISGNLSVGWLGKNRTSLYLLANRKGRDPFVV